MESERSKVKEDISKEVTALWYTNVDGLMSKRLEVEEVLKNEKPDIMVLCETKWRNEWGDPELGMGKYNCINRNRKGKEGGGVIVMIDINIRVVKVEISQSKAEMIKVVVKEKNGKERLYVGVYVPPFTNAWNRLEYNEMIEDVMRELNELVTRGKDVVLIGDFNCRRVNWEDGTNEGGEDSYSGRLLSWSMENLMTQWIDCETRVREGSLPAKLDLLFTSDSEAVEDISYECPLGKSDHVVVKVKVGMELQRSNEEHRQERFRYNRADYDKMRKYFEEVDWSKFKGLTEIEEKWEEFLRIYNKAVERYVPRGEKNCVVGKEWYNARCTNARKCKMKKWNKWREVKSDENWRHYVEARNKSVRINREERYNYEKRIMDKCKSDPKMFYRHVNFKMKKREGISSLEVEGVVYDKAGEMSEVMNKCFQKVFTEEGEFERPRENLEMGVLREVGVHKSEVGKLMEDLDANKAPGPDGVSNWILKECKEQLVDKIYDLVSMSLDMSKLPKDWKRANIVPIYKGGKRSNPLNYRPVSLTSVVGKMCERVVKDAWMKYLEDRKILTARQFGFVSGSSCTSNLLSFYSRVIEEVQERDGWVDGVYLDLKKAFDTVPHKRLLWKIAHSGGVGGKLLNWMEDYLTDREMRTVIRNERSSWLKVTSGVPQGSVLGPVMFGVYVNDMVEGIDSYINLFADDAKVMRRVKDEDDCRKLQEDLGKIDEWSKIWKMNFNLGKCKVMEFGKSSKRVHWDYRMGGVSLEKSKEEVDLGVTVTEGLTPEKHINKITGEVNNLLRRVKMAFAYIDIDMMKKLIVSLVRPRLEYAATVWSPHLKKDIRKLERVQRAATKLVPELRDLGYEERLDRMQIPSLEIRRERGDLINVFRMVNGLERIGGELLKLDRGTTRGHGKKLRKDRCLRDVKKFSFPYRIVDVWNGLPATVVSAKSISKFKTELDRTRYRGGA